MTDTKKREVAMPPLGTGSIDLDKLHAAEAKAKTPEDLDKAIEKAILRVEAPADAAKPTTATETPPAPASDAA